MEIKVSDFVRLNSGGPIMKVAEINDNKATCQWLVKDKKVEEAVFKIETLTLDDTWGIDE